MAREIVSTSDTCSGEPRINGTRLTCGNVVFLHFAGMTFVEFLKVHSYLTIDDIMACAKYCASLQCVADHVINYCHGCTLDKRADESCLNPGYTGTDDVEIGVEEIAEGRVNGWEHARRMLMEDDDTGT
jgi:uncharacterized protein (DUF433 family)